MLTKLKNLGKPKSKDTTVENIDTQSYSDKQLSNQATLYNIPINPNALTGQGVIWAIQGPEGGIGSTTLAANIAASLAKKSPKQVVLVDLNGMGAIRSRMGLPISQCIVNILDWQDIETADNMKQASVEHSSGVIVIPGVVHYDHVPLVKPDFIFRLLTILKRKYAHIVLDCAPTGSELVTWAAVLVSDIVVNVVSPHRTCLDIARDNISFLKRLGCANRVHTIMNQADIPGGIRVEDIKGNPEIGIEVDYILPYSERVIEANNRRELVVNEKPRDVFSLELQKVIEQMLQKTT